MPNLLKWISLAVLCLSTLIADEVINPIVSDLPKNLPSETLNNELNSVERLIEATQQSLKMLRELNNQIKHYQELEERTLEGSNDNDLLYALAKQAYQILETLKAHHLTPNFDSRFIEELSIVSKPIAKQGIPKPS